MNSIKRWIGGIAVMVVLAAPGTGGAWEPGAWERGEWGDSFEGKSGFVLQADATDRRGAWMAISCDSAAPGTYWANIEFGAFAYISLGGEKAKMRVKYGAGKARPDNGWVVLRSEQSQVSRNFVNYQRTGYATFADWTDALVAPATVRYRVTRYDQARLDLQVMAPTQADIDWLIAKCEPPQ